MSGPIAHHFTARAVAETLASRGRVPSNILTENAPFLHFGSQGPDFLFFNSRDWPLGDAYVGVHAFLEIYGTLEEIKQFIVDALPIEEFNRWVDEGVAESTIIDQTASLLREASATSALAQAAIQTGIENLIARYAASEIFNTVIGHPEQRVQGRYQNKENWWWFDTLHYKRTGRYAQALMRNAQTGGRPDEIAYALGYLTHFATDTVGHPYINILSGGPYRTHSQRHKVIENYHDTFLYRHYVAGGELASSKLYSEYILSGTEAFPHLPPNIIDLIRRTMAEVYPDLPATRYGILPTADDLQSAYHLWYLWFKKATSVLDGLPAPVPYSLTRELAEALARFEREMREIESLLSRPSRGGFDILSIFEFLAAAVMGLFKFFTALVDWLIGSLLAIGLAPLRALLSVAYEALYSCFMNLYEGVALSGLAFPYHSMINRPQTLHFLNPSLEDANHHTATFYPGVFPFKQFWPERLRNESHLYYPFTLTAPIDEIKEVNMTNMGPNEYLTSNPVYYLEEGGITVPATYNYLKAMDSERLPDMLRQDFTRNNTLGSARAFSTFLFEEIRSGGNIPDFNLDGDRGFGYKSWRLRASTREMPGTEDDFPRIEQIEENPDRNVPDSLVDNI